MVAIKVDPEAQKRQEKLLAENRCLGCEKEHQEGKAIRRGLCLGCYQKIRTRIAKKIVDEKRLIRDGRLLSPSKGGRPSTNALSAYLAETE